VLLTLFRCTQNGFHHGAAFALALQRADFSPKPAPGASRHHHRSLQSEGKALGVQRLGLWGPVLAAPASKRFRKRIAREIPVF